VGAIPRFIPLLTSQRWKAPWFVGCRQPSRAGGGVRALVGPSRLLGARPQPANAPMTAGVLWENEEGNVVSVRQAHALFVETPNKRLLGRGHVLRSVQRPVHVNRHCNSPAGSESQGRRGGASARISRSGKLTKVRANRHRGLGRRTNARLAARHRSSSKRSCVTRKKRKVVMAIVPARKREPRAQCPYVVVQLQKSAGSILAPNKLARSALKKGGGTSERGSSKAQPSA